MGKGMGQKHLNASYYHLDNNCTIEVHEFLNNKSREFKSQIIHQT